MPVGDRLQPNPLSQSDREFLHGLYQDYYEILLNYVRYTTNSPHPEDIVQDTFLIAVSKISAVKESSNPVGWLIRTSQNCIMRDFSSRAGLRKTLSTEDQHLYEEQFAEPSFENSILLETACRQCLSDEDWNLVYKYYGLGYTSRELAEEFGLKESACRMRIMRARHALLKNLNT